MIRVAEEKDLPELLLLVEEFVLSTGYVNGEDFYSENAEKVLITALSSGAIVVVDRDGLQGLAVAVIFPCMFKDELWAQEICWYVKPAHRKIGLNLLAALECECVLKGASKLLASVLNNTHKQKIINRLKLSGYTEIESVLIKEL